jgi:hypothetical protein
MLPFRLNSYDGNTFQIDYQLIIKTYSKFEYVFLFYLDTKVLAIFNCIKLSQL